MAVYVDDASIPAEVRNGSPVPGLRYGGADPRPPVLPGVRPAADPRGGVASTAQRAASPQIGAGS